MGRPDTWTAEEIQWLRDHYESDPWEVIQNVIHRDRRSIIGKAHHLGLSRSKVRNACFEEWEDEIIKQRYDELGSNGIQARYLTHRTAGSIQCRANRLGVLKPRQWTSDELEILRSAYETMDPVSVMELLPGRTYNSILIMGRKCGLKAASNNHYDEDDIKYIAENYMTSTDQEMADHLGRSKESVKDRRNRLHLHRPKPIPMVGYEDLDQYIRSHNQEWKREAMVACGYKCFLTGDRFTDIHHLFSMNQIRDAVLDSMSIDMRQFDINKAPESIRQEIMRRIHDEQSKYPPGVCLRHDVHMQFHSLYGFGNNTPDQFLEFAIDYLGSADDELFFM